MSNTNIYLSSTLKNDVFTLKRTNIILQPFINGASLVAQMVKKSACNERDLGSVPGLGRSPGERSGNPLQYSCLEKSMD